MTTKIIATMAPAPRPSSSPSGGTEEFSLLASASDVDDDVDGFDGVVAGVAGVAGFDGVEGVGSGFNFSIVCNNY